MLYVNRIVPVQIHYHQVRLLEEKIGKFRPAGTVVRQYQRSGDDENDSGRVLEKNLRVSMNLRTRTNQSLEKNQEL